MNGVPAGIVTVHGSILGLAPGAHGMHVHGYGDLTQGCATLGEHFNPYNETHGGPGFSIRHVGDLGNIVADANGIATFTLEDDVISLAGANAILGRALVVHAAPDDLGLGNSSQSKINGNAGALVGCGVIGITNTAVVPLPTVTTTTPTTTTATRSTTTSPPFVSTTVLPRGFQLAVAVLAGVSGTVWFEQQLVHGVPAGPVTVQGSIAGLAPGMHGFHVHQLGDLTQGCNSSALHYNPYNATHAGPTAPIRCTPAAWRNSADGGCVAATSGTSATWRRTRRGR